MKQRSIIMNLHNWFREMRRYTGDPANKPVIRKLNDKVMPPPTKKIKIEDGEYIRYYV